MSIGRVQWIDDCKGLAILLVILGHTMRTDLSLVYIYGFHMPLFFFLSGLVCNEKKYTWVSFLKSRFNSLIIPYIFFYLLTWLYWLFFERSFRPLGMEWWQPLIGMVYGAQWHGYMDHNGILWFLPCLFMTEVLFFAVKKLSNYGLQLLTVIFFLGLGLFIKSIWPWCFNVSLVALFFFWGGNSARTFLLRKNWNQNVINGSIAIVIFSFFLYLIIAGYFKNEVNMATSQYGNIFIFLVLATLGTVSFVLPFQLFNINLSGLNFLGQNTLIIFALHQPILRIVRYLGAKFLLEFPVDTNFWVALFADIIVIAILIPLIILWNKYGSMFLKRFNI